MIIYSLKIVVFSFKLHIVKYSSPYDVENFSNINENVPLSGHFSDHGLSVSTRWICQSPTLSDCSLRSIDAFFGAWSKDRESTTVFFREIFSQSILWSCLQYLFAFSNCRFEHRLQVLWSFSYYHPQLQRWSGAMSWSMPLLMRPWWEWKTIDKK